MTALEDLIEANIDSKNTLLEAVEAVDNENMKVLFVSIARRVLFTFGSYPAT